MRMGAGAGIGFALALCGVAIAPRGVQAQGAGATITTTPTGTSTTGEADQGGSGSSETGEPPGFTIERLVPAPTPEPQRVEPVPAPRLRLREPMPAAARDDVISEEPELPTGFRPVLTVSYVFAPLLAIGAATLMGPGAVVLFVAPIVVHFIYSDPLGALIALVGYPAAFFGGATVGYAIESPSCGSDGFCGLGGALVGGLVGLVVWPLIDVLVLAPVTWRSNNSARTAVGVRVLSGGAGMIWSGYF